MYYTDFYREHFKDLCCYEDYIMRIDLMGRKHNDRDVLNSLPQTEGHRFIVAGSEVVWIGDDGERIDDVSHIEFIGFSAFRYNSEIVNLTIPDSVTCIFESAFEYCTNIKSVKFPPHLVSIGSFSFLHCESLESVVLNDGVKRIGGNSFASCYKLQHVVIPSSVRLIDYHAFVYCDKLREVKVPKWCYLGTNAFPSTCRVIAY